MPRLPRISYPDALYHVMTRGVDRQPIFRWDVDRRDFLDMLRLVVVRFGWLCHAYCLMDNHYHLVLRTPRGNLSPGMQRLNGHYAQRFNRRHKRVGHLFEGRFRAVLVEAEPHLLELCRYVVLNPVRAGACGGPSDWPWSSYAATAGQAPAPPFLSLDGVLSQLGPDRARARARYRTFVADGAGADASAPSLGAGCGYGAARREPPTGPLSSQPRLTWQSRPRGRARRSRRSGHRRGRARPRRGAAGSGRPRARPR